MIRPFSLVERRALLVVMTVRDIKARYRGSVLGFLWSLANPLLLLGVYSFVFSLVFQPRSVGATPYPLFLVSGLFPWIWVSTSILEGTVSLTANASLIRRSVFPIELLPLVPVLANLVNLVLSFPIIFLGLGVGRWMGFQVGGAGVVALPLVVLLQLPFVSGISLGLAALAAHFKDVRDIVNNLLTLGFFLTPILYVLESVPYASLRWAIRANPLSPYVVAYQDTLFRGVVPAPAVWVHMAAMSLLFWLLGSWLFGRLRETLIEAV
ncbi:MAG: ABC transporter permease [Thermoanaerobaculia bacterium]|nr:ABC transporter permease [Thermoanaerobaculia bacterium]